jgi:hypothetical protein
MATDVNPLDPTTPVGQLRLLISDSQLRTDPGDPSAPAEYYFSDLFLEGFLALNGGNLKLAAADALLALATNESMVSKKIRKENLQTDGPAVTNALRLVAQDYRTQGKADRDLEDSADGTFLVVDFADPVTPFDTFEATAGVLWH